MQNQTADASIMKTARVAGLMFLCSLLVPTLNWIFVLSGFISTDNAIDTARNILVNEFQFRLGIINELISSVIIVVLAWALYVLLKSVHKNHALLALLLKLMEAMAWAVLALGHFIALLILDGQASLTLVKPELLQALVGLFFNAYISITAVPGVFSGLALLIFSYLLFKSKFVPGMLAAFGVLSYALVVIYDSLTILSPDYAAILIIQIICSAPICVFQLVIGIWLLVRGVNIKSRNNSASEFE